MQASLREQEAQLYAEYLIECQRSEVERSTFSNVLKSFEDLESAMERAQTISTSPSVILHVKVVLWQIRQLMEPLKNRFRHVEEGNALTIRAVAPLHLPLPAIASDGEAASEREERMIIEGDPERDEDIDQYFVADDAIIDLCQSPVGKRPMAYPAPEMDGLEPNMELEQPSFLNPEDFSFDSNSDDTSVDAENGQEFSLGLFEAIMSQTTVERISPLASSSASNYVSSAQTHLNIAKDSATLLTTENERQLEADALERDRPSLSGETPPLEQPTHAIDDTQSIRSQSEPDVIPGGRTSTSNHPSRISPPPSPSVPSRRITRRAFRCSKKERITLYHQKPPGASESTPKESAPKNRI